MEYEIRRSDELTHWGIKGMRWGIRRYQNKDGSLTPAGKKRLKAETEAVKKEEEALKKRKAVKAKLEKLEARKKAVEDEKKALDSDDKKGNKSKKSADDTTPGKKSVKDMTDEELVTAINRARMEDTYRQLRPEPVKTSFMKTMVNEVIEPAAKSAGKRFLENAMGQLGENLLKGKADPDSIEAMKKIAEKLELQRRIEKLKNGEDEPDWGTLLKKQQYERNKRKYEAEDAAARGPADEAARAANEPRSSHEYEKTGGTYSRTFNTGSSKTNTSDTVFEGVVEGVGTSSRRATSAGRSWANNSPIIDAEYSEVSSSSITSSGRSYASDVLGLPAPKDDD